MARNTQQLQKADQASQQQLAAQQAQAQQLRQVEYHEAQASASAQAGLNLNIFAAISGVFSGRSKKVTDTAKDGSSKSTEHREEQGAWKGAGHGTMNAVATGQADARERHLKAESESVSQKKAIAAKKEVKEVDHLGLAGLLEDGKK